MAQSLTTSRAAYPGSLGTEGTLDRPIRLPASKLSFFLLAVFTGMVYLSPVVLFPRVEPLHLPRVVAILALVSYLIGQLLRSQPITVLRPEVKLAAGLLVVAVLSIPFSTWRGGSFDALTTIFVKSVLIFFLMVNVLQTRTRLRRLIWVTVIVCGVIAVRAFLDYQGGFLDRGRLTGDYSALVLNPNDLALTLVLTIPLLVSLLRLTRSWLIKAAGVMILLLMIFDIFVTYSRGGFLALMTLGIMYVTGFVRRGRIIPLLVLAAGGVMGFILFAPPGYSERIITIFNIGADPTGSAQMRWESIKVAAVAVLMHPILGLGIGMNGLYIHDVTGQWTIVHNVYLQIAADIGLIGLFIYLRLLYLTISRLRVPTIGHDDGGAQRESAILADGIRRSLIAFAVGAMFHPVAYHFYFYFLAGFSVSLQEIVSREATPDGTSGWIGDSVAESTTGMRTWWPPHPR